MTEERKEHRWNKKVKEINLEFIGDVQKGSHNHEIHIFIGIEATTKYTWKMEFYDDEDNLLSSSSSDGKTYGDFDQTLFNDTKSQVGYRTTVVIEFVEEIDPKLIDNTPYDPYMYDKNIDEYTHVDTLQEISYVDAEDTDPFIGDKDVPLILVIDNVSWVPPDDQEQVWNKYNKFDDWVYSDFISYIDWYNL